MINGEPVADPIVRLAAIPTLLAVLFFTGILTVLAFFGVGLFIFLAALMFMMLGVFIVAPYSWPVLLIIILMMTLVFLIGSGIASLVSTTYLSNANKM